ncbi:hypothetical protein ACFORL_08205 [Legionella dresdenensis]|uniref:Plasmid pRiA4b Orf3-like domain-containing protein n=1 Tax=Legionella dresdenensis TaxID=450200 RepID=A0ABV8CGE1_9GAMM
MSLKNFFNSGNLPGTILKDLNYFLHFMQENRFKTTGKKGLLPNHCLPIINSNMSHPLKLTLKREQQLSYPHINALYLLTRNLGLIHIEQIKNSRFLTANNEVIAVWNNLTEIEQYLNLMQAWLFYCDERLISKGKKSSFPSILDTVCYFLKIRLEQEWKIKNTNQQKWEFYATPPYSIALMEMFGFIDITDNEQHTESWLISNITVNNYGKSWANLLNKFKRLEDESDFCIHRESNDDKSAKQFYQELSSMAPQWQSLFRPPKKVTEEGMHFFKVSLSKDVWRRISIPGIETLDVLASFILHVFKFDEDHLYQFTYTDKFGSLQTIESGDKYFWITASPNEVKIGDIDIFIGDSLEFLFDFGDCWRFNVQLEQIDNSSKNKKIKLIESAGRAPRQYTY